MEMNTTIGLDIAKSVFQESGSMGSAIALSRPMVTSTKQKAAVTPCDQSSMRGRFEHGEKLYAAPSRPDQPPF
ncbi:hypothetical protein [Bradyrhizobium sp. 6(2017)]|uniref:hypothetical protein n=1 Tax=Bradyrhizobium sp. 6(2017) TaxID=1197460 RepID=UPI0013E14658|nr:hypothetical protein [Bradyrhizobium sp. 6(2017)]QIG97314.1 hypothetical protein G6P99_36300 [Bradyrhizobium sp. 6(2017)]